MDILQLVDRMEDILEEASSVPFSSKVILDVDEIYEIIQEIRIQLPDEIKQATWIKEERQRILTEAKDEASELIKQAEEQVDVLVDKNQITKMAIEKGEEIVNKAKISAKGIRDGSLHYADNILLKTQENLKEVINSINTNREELRTDNESAKKED